MAVLVRTDRTLQTEPIMIKRCDFSDGTALDFSGFFLRNHSVHPLILRPGAHRFVAAIASRARRGRRLRTLRAQTEIPERIRSMAPLVVDRFARDVTCRLDVAVAIVSQALHAGFCPNAIEVAKRENRTGRIDSISHREPGHDANSAARQAHQLLNRLTGSERSCVQTKIPGQPVDAE